MEKSEKFLNRFSFWLARREANNRLFHSLLALYFAFQPNKIGKTLIITLSVKLATGKMK